MIVDYAFGPHVLPQTKRRRAAVRDGLWHGGTIAPRDPLPDAAVTLTFWSNAHRPIDRVAVYYTADGSEPDGERGTARHGAVVLAEPDGALADPDTRRPLRRWLAVIPGQPEGTLVRYRADGFGQRRPRHSFRADAVDPVAVNVPRGRVFAYSVDRFAPPDWFADAVFYQIFVDRFSAAHDEPPLTERAAMTDFFGGTLRGATERLDYLAELGVTALWLSPVMTSPTYHGYDPGSFDEVAARYGGTAALRGFIAAAHARGLKVVLDFVANHTSTEHPLFRAALADPASPHRAWYTIDGRRPYGYKVYYHVKSMPELNTELPAVQEYLIDAARRWLDDFGADGLRLDNVSGPSMGFWSVFQRAIKTTNPGALTLGEVTGGLEVAAAYAGRMDAVMDFPLTRQLRRVFAQRAAPLAELLADQQARAGELVPGQGRATLLDNHDMHRFLWLAENDRDRLKIAAACLLTLPGTPIIYYGTEVGVAQRAGPYGQDAFARMPMRWGADQDGDLLAWFRRLIALRRDHPALRGGAWLPVDVRPVAGQAAGIASQVGGYARVAGDDVVIIVLNNALEPATVAVRLPAQLAGRAGQAVVDRLSGAVIGEFPAGEDVVVMKVLRLGVSALGWQ